MRGCEDALGCILIMYTVTCKLAFSFIVIINSDFLKVVEENRILVMRGEIGCSEFLLRMCFFKIGGHVFVLSSILRRKLRGNSFKGVLIY